jgi:tricarballylate dehydrogenase
MDAHEVDVVVVGAGNAALVAALTAHQAGARVLVLEAADEAERGGNSRFSGGIFRTAHDGLDHLAPLLDEDSRRWLDRVACGPYPPGRYLADLQTTSAGQSDPELIQLVVDRSYETVAWMREQGVRFELTVGKLVDPEKIAPGETYHLPPGGVLRARHEGIGLMADLFEAVERAGIDVWYGAPAHDLLLSGDRVDGVRVRRSDRYVDVRGAVVLASGGFESSPALRQQFLGPGWDLVKVRGTRFNTGTMLRRALDAGAQAFGHWGGCHASPLDANAPPVGDLALTDRLSRYSYPYAILVNAEARRFVDEGEDEVWLTYAKTGSAIREQPRALAFQIFDQKTVHLIEPRYETGTPIEAETLGELACAIGVDAGALERTVQEFNAATRPGRFDPFAKDGLATEGLAPPKSNWAQPIDAPPFVTYPVTCGITFTYGGLKVDAEGRVLSGEDRPMPGLFATGEITGGFFFHNYPAGSGLMRGAVFGRIAGASAAAWAHEMVATR